MKRQETGYSPSLSFSYGKKGVPKLVSKDKIALPKRMNCIKCETSHPFKDGFYSTSDTDFYPLGKLPVCKNCCQKNIEDKGFDGFMDLLRLINKPLLEENFKDDFFEYVKNVNSLPQFRGMTFLQSTKFEANKAIDAIKRAKPSELSEEELRESEDYFGRGYEESDYIFLKYEMDSWRSQYEVDSKALEDLIREICLTQLDIRKRRSDNKDVDKQLKTLQDLLGSSNLKPMQETGNQAGEMHETFGGLIRKFENERPIPTPDPLWADVDGIGKYIRTFFLGHMAKLLGKENRFQQEYDEMIDEYTVNPHKEEDD